MILAEFEKEFRNFYGQNYKRSQEYLNVKADIESSIKEYIENKKGQARRYSKNILRSVENLDNSYAQNLRYALEENQNIMDIFVQRRFDKKYEEVIKDFADRIGAIRNGIAHNRMDLQYEAIDLVYIQLVEELLYAMRFNNIGIDEKESQKAINDLFNEQIGL